MNDPEEFFFLKCFGGEVRFSGPLGFAALVLLLITALGVFGIAKWLGISIWPL
jgi:hypothetical protein